MYIQSLISASWAIVLPSSTWTSEEQINSNSTIGGLPLYIRLDRFTSIVVSQLPHRQIPKSYKWSKDWVMEFNTSKCKVLKVTRKKMLCAEDRSYSLGDQNMQVICGPHIQLNIAHWLRMCSEELLSLYWTTRKPCHTQRLMKISILPLEHRREISDLLLLFKSRNRLITTDIKKLLCTFESRYRTRNFDPNNFHFTLKHKQDYYRNSYFITSAELWNSLPSSLKSCTSLHLFKFSINSFYFSKLPIYRPPGKT